MNPLDLEPQTLATAAQAPILVLLAWMLRGLRRGAEERCGEDAARPDPGAPPRMRHDPDALSRTRDELAAFKLEVARTYVPLSLIRDVDQRLSRQLLRIEEKLDAATRAATAAAALQSAQRGWRSEDRS
ncbi:hypothetical protein CR162_05915 [Pseudoroseomonas rhizosphaerae]|uniref:Uncharacterized protein n=1 Tax=Teichococcus rhizosphaerae TaxID=1335062 RepID=A0A2C6Y506_9PROT|nr:hypothetical protein [Pseudoroseomonas rhizosphaerae]PHK95872.1 hypothetical protein CR162_05915 [Pseudoroseomonas rhizosphaerae]